MNLYVDNIIQNFVVKVVLFVTWAMSIYSLQIGNAWFLFKNIIYVSPLVFQKLLCLCVLPVKYNIALQV